MPILCDVVEPGIVALTISNPRRRNALDLDMFESLASCWFRMQDDRTVKVVLLRGDGDKAFCSGADLDSHLDRRADVDDLVDRALLKTGYFPKRLVAAVTGACTAGGLELVLSTDIRIAAYNASIGLPEVRWGLVPSGGGAMKLVDQIGLAKAMDMLLTGRLVSGTEAATIGLVSEACLAENVWDRALDRARCIARNSAGAVAAAKRAALFRRSQLYHEMEPDERHLVAKVRASGDPEEGKAAFLAKREPNFRA
jgi:enoyl-CoA hydratase